jgi:hypothetical protein
MRLRVGRRLQLLEVEKLEAVRPEQADPVTVAEVELDTVPIVETMHPELRPDELLDGRHVAFG